MLLFLFLGCCYSIVHAGDDEKGFVVVPTSSFQPETVCSTARVNLEQNHSTVSVPLVHRHGPWAPWQSTDWPSFREMLRRNRARSSTITSRASRGAASARDDKKVVIPSHIGDAVDSLEYVVTVGLGTPAVRQTVLLDTGSDVSWVQCAPCGAGECSSQKDPLFDPSRSSTYRPMPCSSGACRDLGAYGNGCTNGTDDDRCRFAILYEDGTVTGGVYSSDKLTLTSVDTVGNFLFGCAHDERPSGKYDGLLALGRLPMSLVSQASSQYRGAFSYCLPAVNSRSGFLALGVRMRSDTTGFALTPLGTSPLQAPFYVVTMTGIAVGGKQLVGLRLSAFAGGMIIDSGKVVTALPSTAYRALRTAFRKAMAPYPLVPNGHLDTCYNLTGHKNVTVPKVALTFSGGATINLDVPNGILVEGCLVFEDSGGDGSVAVLGNVNQRNFEVLYDTSHSKVGFGPIHAEMM
ncbi:hypothetical protein C2845_PM09G12660 [Panicum miliaceum]|uniref:Peptidase A1 domain-containing protein n=1 Tax=Panicum miliaceum TaxID=4540 RepID=A0A3L6S200_PANMI|nr:hypothetical protein C2845_PM09G12660 [Panicum miliaceum]